MKKIITLLLGIALIYSCSTTNNENTTTTEVVPIAPTNLTGNVVSTTQVNLSWIDNSTNEIGFKIERRSGTSTYTVVGSLGKDVLTFSDTNLTPNTTYVYRVFSFNAVGNSITYSNEFIIKTYTLMPQVTIGTQIWSSMNLEVSVYSDGTPIPQVTDPTAWSILTTGAWCYYKNDSTNGVTYGKLYNWYAVAGIYDAASLTNASLRKQLAPAGWHVPKDTEWTTLTNFLGGESIAGGYMKETGTTHWISPNLKATNSSNFTGLPGGYRNIVGTFYDLTGKGYWWSSTESNPTYAWNRNLFYIDGTAYRTNDLKLNGYSVRCLRD